MDTSAPTAGPWAAGTRPRARPAVDTDHDALVGERGPTDFEGRSYRGWHHHVTLVSVAHGYEAVRSAPARRLRAGPGSAHR